MSALPRYTKPLPQCEGPKLHPLKGPRYTIKFLRLLSDIESEGHAHVFEVSMGSKKYALKVFKFYDDEEDRDGLFGIEKNLVPVHLFRAHMDPFYNECRAFGRIIESNQNGKIAVRCYGHLAVPPEREEELKQRFNIESWNRPDEERASERQPFRAILKDLVLGTVPFTDKQVKKMLRDLKRLRRLGVYPRDVQARNYVGGLLVDMSIAITEPHFLFTIRPKWHVREVKLADLLSFDTMMEEEKIRTWHRAARNEEYCMKLRSRKAKDSSSKK